MESAKTWLYLVYWVLLLSCCSLFFFDEWMLYGNILRVVLMPVLGAYMAICTKATHSKTLKIFFGLFILLSWIGDIGFLFDGNQAIYFSFGCYAIANLFLGFSFKKIRPIKLNKATFPSLAFIVGAIIIYALFFKFISKSKIGSMKPPYIINMISLTFAFVFAANILDSNSRKKLAYGYFLPAIGITFFSVGLFALNKYMINEPKVNFLVTLTYGYAQLLLIEGYRKTSR